MGVLEGRIIGRDDDLREQRRHGCSAQLVDELLLKQIADHPLALGSEQVERVRGHVRIGLALERQQADLQAVAVGDHELVLAREHRDRLDCRAHGVPLGRGICRLATT
jgi:hypothetical protein